MNDGRNLSCDSDEDTVGELLRLAGARLPMPPSRLARMHEAVHRHWQEVGERRAVRRRIVAAVTASLAAVAIVFFAVRMATPERSAPSTTVVAVVNRIEGSVPELAVEARLPPGRWIETTAGARVGLRLINGASVRLDAQSRLRLASERLIELTRGAVYVDSDRDQNGLEVKTPFATAKDIGTQFELRLIGDEVRLGVRSGIVELRNEQRSTVARPGIEVILAPTGTAERRLAVHGPHWDWTAQVAPRVRLAGRALSSVLEEIARERGWLLRYDDPELARDASGFVLHGSLEGLSAADALDVATATSGLRHRLEGGDLIISRHPAAR